MKITHKHDIEKAMHIFVVTYACKENQDIFIKDIINFCNTHDECEYELLEDAERKEGKFFHFEINTQNIGFHAQERYVTSEHNAEYNDLFGYMISYDDNSETDKNVKEFHEIIKKHMKQYPVLRGMGIQETQVDAAEGMQGKKTGATTAIS